MRIMVHRLLYNKKDLYLFLSVVFLIGSIFTFNLFDYKYYNAAATYKEKVEDESFIIMTDISREKTFSKSIIKRVIK